MVRFDNDKLVIEIPAGNRRGAIEIWSELHSALCDVMYNITPDTMVDDTYFYLPMLLREMLPPWDDAVLMLQDKQ